MSFKNKVVIITGASSGIGAATAKQFAKEGASLALVGRNEERLIEVARKCQVFRASTVIIKAEMTNDNDVKAIVDKTVAKFNKLDVLVNNAGILKSGSLLDGKLMEDYDQLMNVNIRSYVLLTTFALPYLKQTKGNIVNVSSVLGHSFMGHYSFMAYCMSKAALSHFTRGAALELSSVDVRVNSISPGLTRTSLSKNAGFDATWEDWQKTFKLKRISDPEEVGDMIVYLASEKAKSVTGADFLIDNGVILKN